MVNRRHVLLGLGAVAASSAFPKAVVAQSHELGRVYLDIAEAAYKRIYEPLLAPGLITSYQELEDVVFDNRDAYAEALLEAATERVATTNAATLDVLGNTSNMSRIPKREATNYRGIREVNALFQRIIDMTTESATNVTRRDAEDLMNRIANGSVYQEILPNFMADLAEDIRLQQSAQPAAAPQRGF